MSTLSPSNSYLVLKNGLQLGPYNLTQLRTEIDALRIAWSDIAWTEGMVDWVPLTQIAGLTPPTPPARSVPPTPPSVAKPIPSSHKVSAKQRPRKALVIIICAVVTILTLLAALVWWKIEDKRHQEIESLLVLADKAIAIPKVQETEKLLGKLEELGAPGTDLSNFQYTLGRAYAGGHGTIKDEAHAAHWYEKAANSGHAEAQYSLGIMFIEGRKPYVKDEIKAVEWFRLAAEQGLPESQWELGLSYFTGNGVPKDRAEALKWWGLSAEQGNAFAQTQLGLCYLVGEDVTKDEIRAVEWFRLAAVQGYSEAQYYLALCYFKGEGVPKDELEAVQLAQKAAEQGWVDAQIQLAFCYEEGRGVSKSSDEAMKWWKLAADQGNAQAQAQYAKYERIRSGKIIEVPASLLKPLRHGGKSSMILDSFKGSNQSSNLPSGGSLYYAEKMSKIIFPNVMFAGASIDEAVEFLRIRSRDYDTIEKDPARKGVNLILRAGKTPSTALITLDLTNVPMLEALQYTTELAGMEFRVEPAAVIIFQPSSLTH